jgi:hypothetical protein
MRSRLRPEYGQWTAHAFKSTGRVGPSTFNPTPPPNRPLAPVTRNPVFQRPFPYSYFNSDREIE